MAVGMRNIDMFDPFDTTQGSTEEVECATGLVSAGIFACKNALDI